MPALPSKLRALIFPFNATKSFEERRADSRYTIKAPASLTLDDASSASSCMLFLLDISSGGALVRSTWIIPENGKVTLRTKLPFQQKWFGRDEVELIFPGRVVRCDEKKGLIAVQFDEDYRIKLSMVK